MVISPKFGVCKTYPVGNHNVKIALLREQGSELHMCETHVYVLLDTGNCVPTYNKLPCALHALG